MNGKSKMITQSPIINIGWTKTMIKNLLPELYKHMDYCKRKLINWNSHYYNEFESFEDVYDAYEFALSDYENFEFHMPNEETLNRWVVNYIRHNLVNYDFTLSKNRGKVGKNEAYPVFKKAVLERIATVYPKYAAECLKQTETIGVTCYA